MVEYPVPKLTDIIASLIERVIGDCRWQIWKGSIQVRPKHRFVSWQEHVDPKTEVEFSCHSPRGDGTMGSKFVTGCLDDPRSILLDLKEKSLVIPPRLPIQGDQLCADGIAKAHLRSAQNREKCFAQLDVPSIKR